MVSSNCFFMSWLSTEFLVSHFFLTGWRSECKNHHVVSTHEGVVLDRVATAINIFGFICGGFLSSIVKHHQTSQWFQATIDSLRQGFLGSLMSFPYILMTGAHISIIKDSYLDGALYVFMVLIFGLIGWWFGWTVGKTNFFSCFLVHQFNVLETYVSTLHHGQVSTYDTLNVIETVLSITFMILSWYFCRNLETPIDIQDPNFVKYHTLSWPLGSELVLNIAFSCSGLFVSSLM